MKDIIESIKLNNPNEKEYHQTVREVGHGSNEILPELHNRKVILNGH